MQYKMEVEAYLQYLSLVQKGLIKFDMLEKLDGFDKKKTDSVLRMLRMGGLVDVQQFLEKMIDCEEYERIENILRDYVVYRKDVVRRDFLFEHEDNIYLRQIARLLQNDFLFNDKKFLDKVIAKTENKSFVWEQFLTIDTLSGVVDKNPVMYEEGLKREILEMTFDISSPFDSLKFAELLKVKHFNDNPIWLSYFKNWCNQEKTKSTLGVMKNVDVDKFYMLEEKGKMDFVHEKLVEIDSSEMTIEEKRLSFSRLVKNVSKLDEALVDKEEVFLFLMECISKEEEDFDYDMEWICWFSNENDKNKPFQKRIRKR